MSLAGSTQLDPSFHLFKVISYYDLFKNGYRNGFSTLKSPSSHMILSESADVTLETLLLT